MNRIESFFRRNPHRLAVAEACLKVIALYGIFGFVLNGIAAMIFMTVASRSVADPQVLVSYTLQLACALMAFELICLITVGIVYPRFDQMVARIETDPPADGDGDDNLRDAHDAPVFSNSGANILFAPFHFLTVSLLSVSGIF
jgi:hypothetical protein